MSTMAAAPTLAPKMSTITFDTPEFKVGGLVVSARTNENNMTAGVYLRVQNPLAGTQPGDKHEILLERAANDLKARGFTVHKDDVIYSDPHGTRALR